MAKKSTGTDHFKNAIQSALHKKGKEDPLFAQSLEKPGKNLEDCINYILQEVRKIGAQGYTDDEIYGLAYHYYDEDDLAKAKPIDCKVVVNHKPELTEEEKEELREQARKEVIQEQKQKMTSKKSPSVKPEEKKKSQLSLL